MNWIFGWWRLGIFCLIRVKFIRWLFLCVDNKFNIIFLILKLGKENSMGILKLVIWIEGGIYVWEWIVFVIVVYIINKVIIYDVIKMLFNCFYK